MSDDRPFYDPDHRPAPTRQAQPGELLFEFHVAETHTFYRVELRTHGKDIVEAQFLDPVDVRMARTFHQYMDPTRTPREMAITWAEEELKAMLQCPTCRDGCGWLCETHPDQSWPHDNEGRRCAGPGTQCSRSDCPWWNGAEPLARRRTLERHDAND
jgi:hypothetical protein